ncbi:hypothetical protein [Kitasatospora indigofera]|uniref:hypothetical protein n=1 Tax=Kitasatospora indigofera TaxID=67307 RepID=UPI0036B18BFF
MRAHGRRYRYVGPADLRAAVRSGQAGARIGDAAEFARWAAARTADELADPFTFVVAADGFLRLAPRRSEHVACAGGEAVLGAGEAGFRRSGSGGWSVDFVSNQSTGYCPDVTCWPAVARALDRAGLEHPGGFTYEVVFRRCPACQELNIVREEHFVCVFCDTGLPGWWNVDDGGPAGPVRPGGPGEAPR